jgi:hypothetical protein
VTPRRPDPSPPPESRSLACRSCGCADLRVVWTYRAVDRTIRRRRRCRHCGTETTTIERTLGEEPGGQAKRGAS